MDYYKQISVEYVLCIEVCLLIKENSTSESLHDEETLEAHIRTRVRVLFTHLFEKSEKSFFPKKRNTDDIPFDVDVIFYKY